MEWLRNMKTRMAEVHGPTFVLVCFFSISSWIDLYGVWVEFPLIINAAPEGWNLPSYLAVVIQCANIGPISYTIINRFYPNKKKEVVTIYIIISVGAVATFLLSFYWNKTVIFAGAERSIPLLALIGALSLVDCTSTVVYIPFMARFTPAYIPGYYIGEGLGGLFPGLVGLIQGAGTDPECRNVTITEYNETTGFNHTFTTVYPFYHPPRFSVGTFFGILCGMMCCSGLAFTLLNFLPSSKREMAKVNYEIATPLNDLHDIDNEHNHNEEAEFPPLKESDRQMSRSGDIWVPRQPWKSANGHMYETIDKRDSGRDLKKAVTHDHKPEQTMSNRRLACLLGCSCFISFQIYGVFGAIQPYACLPYGGLAYTLAIRLITVINPIVSTAALFIPTTKSSVLGTLITIGTCFHVYILTLAFLSPEPPLVGTTLGMVIVILANLTFQTVLVYSLITVATLLRVGAGHRGLVFMGAMVQGGSLLGTIVAFCLINLAQVFESAPECGISEAH